MTDVFEHVHRDITGALRYLMRHGKLPEVSDLSQVKVETPRQRGVGHMACNAGLALSKPMGMPPMEIADILARGVVATWDHIARAETAKPGFLNMTFADSFWHDELVAIEMMGEDYGNQHLGQEKAVNVEYVSANPTGPLTVGHARGAVFGDALASVLQKANYTVTREYYVNDAGSQVDDLARSVHLRIRELLGEDIGDFPADLYPAEYVTEIARDVVRRDKGHETIWLEMAEDEWLPKLRHFSIECMMRLIGNDLEALGVHHNVFTHERDLVRSGMVSQAVESLRAKGLIYRGELEPPKGGRPDVENWRKRDFLLFRSTEFGDDSDRPVEKADGSHTYFASDLAYHLDKIQRGNDILIDVLGADHGGYVKRLKASTEALSNGRIELHAPLCQMVSLTRDGEPVRMSKRSGNFVTLGEVIDEVGAGVVRFIMLTRKNDAQLEFDLDKVVQESKENPYYYVQYAHARCHSVLMSSDLSPARDALHRLKTEYEIELIREMVRWPSVISGAAQAYEPHRVAFYLQDLASALHGLWNAGNKDASQRVRVEGDQELTKARLFLITAAKLVLASGLEVIGVEPLDRLESEDMAA